MATKTTKVKKAERAAPPHLPTTLDVLLSRLQCQAALGVSKRYFSTLLSAGEFPGPDTRFGKCPRWKTSTVNGWILARCEKGE